MHKKVFALLLCAALLFALAACGGTPASSAPPADASGSAPQPADGDSTAAGDAVEIVFSASQDASGATQAAVDEFNKLHEGEIFVKFIELPSDVSKQHDLYVTSFSSGGTEYDVINGDCVWPSEFSNADYVLALDRFVERDGLDMGSYMDGPVAGATFKGKLWALPTNIDSGILYYRTDLIDAPPETWEDLLALAGEAKAAGAEMGYVTQAKQYEGLVCNALEFIASYGGSVVDGDGNITINSPETVEGLTMMKNIFTSDTVPSNLTTFTENETVAAFVEGQAAMARNWGYMWPLAGDEESSKVAGNVAVAPMPKGPAGSASCLGGRMGMINKNTQHPDEAWEFLKYYAGPEGQKIMSIQGGQTPTLSSLFEDADVLEATPFYADENFLEALMNTVPRPVTPIYAKISEIMQIEISKMLSGQISVEDAVTNMDQQMNEALLAM